MAQTNRLSFVAACLVLQAACAKPGGGADASLDAMEDLAPDVGDEGLDSATDLPDTVTADTAPDTAGEDPGAEDVGEEEAVVDTDGDTVPDDVDAFPTDGDEWADNDDDGTGDNADTDDDNDTIADDEELAYGTDCRISSPLHADTDGDTIGDPDDPYPLDPWPEFLVNRNDLGTFYFFLSNRDGTFMPRYEEGEDIGDDYTAFTIADFDGNGKMDFIGHSETPDALGEWDLYYFYRTARMDEFTQRLVGPTDDMLGGTVADVNDDTLIDIVDVKVGRPAGGGYITTVTADTFINNGTILTATCAYEDHPSTACAFTRIPAFDITGIVGGQWGYVQAQQAVDVTGDTIKDFVFGIYASGGNSPVPVYRLQGNGDGTFASPTLVFTHNSSGTQSPANAIVFADFDDDDMGDVILGFDDDGDPGQSWIYFGLGGGAFSSTGVSTIDVNTAIESGSDDPGRTSAVVCFDFDFDGSMDVIEGHNLNMAEPFESLIQVWLGLGTGQFAAPLQVGPTLSDQNGNAFAIPTRLCPWYVP